MTQAHPDLTFVVPCLNEAQSLPLVLRKINSTREKELEKYKSEVVVSDNGSIDGSKDIACLYGAQVVDCYEKGYGAAIMNGITHAKGDVIIFADADGTYDFGESPLLIDKLEKGYSLVLGSRIKGTVLPGSMPFLHRYLGTPILNFIINSLYSRNNYRTSDCNSGFRCFNKEEFLKWGVSSKGMEFASEMLIKAMKDGSKIAEVPISLYPDHPGRIPHLKTWRDGMRHLLRIFVDSPSFFNNSGTFLFLVSFTIALISLLIPDYLYLFGLSIFGIHTMMISFLGMVFGQLLWGCGLFITVKNGASNRIYERIINLSEDVLFWLIVGLVTLLVLAFGFLIVYWAILGFENLEFQKQTLFATAVGVNGLILISNFLTAHLLKRN